MRVINRVGDRMMNYMRDKIYSPALRFILNQQILAFGILLTVLILTVGAIGGNIIRVTLFPSIASDRVSIDLLMPEGVNPERTDSIISMVEAAAWRVNEEYTEKQNWEQTGSREYY